MRPLLLAQTRSWTPLINRKFSYFLAVFWIEPPTVGYLVVLFFNFKYLTLAQDLSLLEVRSKLHTEKRNKILLIVIKGNTS